MSVRHVAFWNFLELISNAVSLNDKPLDRIHEMVANIHEMVAKEIIAQLRAELSRTQMAGCELPLANVIHSVNHCVRRLCS